MAKLPFVVEPRRKPEIVTIGTEDSGTIEIVRKGYLTAGEKAFMQSQSSNDTVLRSLLSLSRDVAKELGIDTKEAYNLINKALQNENGEEAAKIWGKFSEELSSILSSMIQQDSMNRIMKCYCLLLYRIDGDIEAEEVNDLHEDLVTELVDLYDREESKSNERLIRELGLEEEEEVVTVGIEAAEKK